MARVQCNICGARYDTTQRDGTAYFHVCGPMRNPDHQPDPSKDHFDPRETIERPKQRDERPRPEVFFQDGKPHVAAPNPEEKGQTIAVPTDRLIISEGDGVTPCE